MASPEAAAHCLQVGAVLPPPLSSSAPSLCIPPAYSASVRFLLLPLPLPSFCCLCRLLFLSGRFAWCLLFITHTRSINGKCSRSRRNRHCWTNPSKAVPASPHILPGHPRSDSIRSKLICTELFTFDFFLCVCVCVFVWVPAKNSIINLNIQLRPGFRLPPFGVGGCSVVSPRAVYNYFELSTRSLCCALCLPPPHTLFQRPLPSVSAISRTGHCNQPESS